MMNCNKITIVGLLKGNLIFSVLAVAVAVAVAVDVIDNSFTSISAIKDVCEFLGPCLSLASLVFSIILIKKIHHPFKVFNEHMDQLCRFDLREGPVCEWLQKNEERVDEFGLLARKLREFRIPIDTLMSQIINKNIQQLSSSQKEMMETLKVSSENIEQEFLEVDQVATAATELAATASDVAQNASHAESITVTTSQIINVSTDTLDKSKSITEEITASMKESEEAVTQLIEHSENINSVVDVINQISEQTNLLALNAAIEAARAGEQGRGFAVVADEVRTLAAKTQLSTGDIQNSISKLQELSLSVQNFSQQNSALVDRFSDISCEISKSFNSMLTNIEEVSGINSIVATASEEQSAVTQDISMRLETINLLTKENVTNSNYISNSILGLDDLIKTLKEETEKFTVSG